MHLADFALQHCGSVLDAGSVPRELRESGDLAHHQRDRVCDEQPKQNIHISLQSHRKIFNPGKVIFVFGFVVCSVFHFVT